MNGQNDKITLYLPLSYDNRVPAMFSRMKGERNNVIKEGVPSQGMIVQSILSLKSVDCSFVVELTSMVLKDTTWLHFVSWSTASYKSGSL